jgi:hypothetical protein
MNFVKEFAMKSRVSAIVVFVFGLAAVAGWSTQIFAQEDDLFGSNSTSEYRPAAKRSSSPPASSQPAARYFYQPAAGMNPRGNPSGSLRQAAEAVRNAKGEDEATAAKKKLNELVDKFFDEDMAQRQKELKQLEDRLAKLREQLERRKTKKQDIVDLQMKVLLNEADGLGFFSAEAERPNPTPGPPTIGAPSLYFRNDPTPNPGLIQPIAPAAPPAAPATPAEPAPPKRSQIPR